MQAFMIVCSVHWPPHLPTPLFTVYLLNLLAIIIIHLLILTDLVFPQGPLLLCPHMCHRYWSGRQAKTWPTGNHRYMHPADLRFNCISKKTHRHMCQHCTCTCYIGRLLLKWLVDHIQMCHTSKWTGTSSTWGSYRTATRKEDGTKCVYKKINYSRATVCRVGEENSICDY